MKSLMPSIALVLAGATLGHCASGQTIYRCGSTYSQQPCPGAVTVDVNDSRTPEQKTQADAASAHAAKAADKMEKQRLAQEKTQFARLSKTSSRPAAGAKATQPASSDAPARGGAKTKKKEPEYFTVATKSPAKEKSAKTKQGEAPQGAMAGKAGKPAKP